MEANQLAAELQNLQTPTKGERDSEKETKSITQPQVVASRCTRSQVAPDWTVEEMLILVCEIAAVEGDHLKALPSYQKWKIIADNCAALDVVRNINQCRRKWDALLAEYKKIKEWESQSGTDSYWSLEIEKKKEFGLPGSFELDLFNSIHDLVKFKEEQSDPEPDSDSEAADVLDVIMDSGSKKKRRKRGPQKIDSAERDHDEIAAKLQENAELIHAILRGDLSGGDINTGLTGLSNHGALHTEFTRRQGDELIKVLGTLVGSLNQLLDVVQENK